MLSFPIRQLTCKCRASSLPYFSLSWVLTLLAHDLISVEVTSRIFDFLMAHNPAMVSYLCAAVSNDLSPIKPMHC